MDRVYGVRGLRRYAYILTVLERSDKGGTVVPPCDFHPQVPESPLNKGIPP